MEMQGRDPLQRPIFLRSLSYFFPPATSHNLVMAFVIVLNFKMEVSHKSM